MRKIIDGKVYDTETAEKVAATSSGYDVSLAGTTLHEDTLYRTRKGAWYVHDYYACRMGNPEDSEIRETITPLADEEAHDWLAERDFVDELRERFPESSVVEA